MTDEVWQRPEPQSPCRKICVIHPEAGLCVGCLRTAAEIAAWPTMTAETRRQLMEELPARQGQLTRRRGGRAARLGS
ncbi:DUF1289 domain-containing protein [Rubellimicrobium arenae]|uniref:DUF1289 domain-containing protein n=1 Tax=Rubellimicrobium arenae TaxID=2817372 RepID=UPI001B304941|nr:DUF1289 domain-containing protein [Rubellimicrobium arenae]